MFIAHVGAMDNLAFALKKAAQIYEENVLKQMVDQRYLSFNATELGRQIEKGNASLADCEAFITQNNEPKQTSGKQEAFERVFNNYFI